MAINQDISNLPTPPSRSDSPSDFSDKADSFLGSLPTFQSELNTYADQLNSTQSEVNTSESNAEASAQASAASADTAESFSDAAIAVVNAELWDSATVYNETDAVVGSDGNTYRSLINSNVGNNPVNDDGTKWRNLTSGEKATLTKTFISGEEVSLELSSPVATAPVVSATKEVPQVGVTNNSWDVAPDGTNYTLHDTAYSTTLTPSDAGADGTFTLGTGSFAAEDVGKKIVGNGGTAFLTATDGSYSLDTAFNDTSTIAAGDWSMFALDVESAAAGLVLSGFVVGYDLQNASYDNVNFDVSGQENSPTSVVFNDDGTKMYVVGSANNTIYQYSLNVGFDISTASYDSVSLSVSSQDSQTQGITFKEDGTKMYMIGDGTTSVYQYTLSTPFDLSTASYDSISFSVDTQSSGPSGVSFKTDGSKMYVIGKNNDSVFQYGLSTAWDISTASYDNVSIDVSSEDISPNGIIFKPDGSKMYVIGDRFDTVYQYTLLTSWDLSTASYDSISFSVGSEGAGFQSLAFKTDGTKMYVLEQSNDLVHQYNTGSSTAPTSANHTAITSTSTNTEFWTDINSMTADDAPNDGSVYYAVSTDDRQTWKIIDDAEGTERAIVRNNAGTWEYNDASDYGTETWVAASENDEFYALEEAVDISTAQSAIGFGLENASYDNVSFDISSQDTNPEKIVFNNDGTKMYLVGNSSDSVHQYTLSNAFDISTASYDSVSFSVSSQDSGPRGIAFNNDGSKMYIVGNVTGSCYQYSLSQSFEISTASYDSISFDVSSQESSPQTIVFNNDGTKMYIAGTNSASAHQYTLSTAFDLSTASFDSISFNTSSEGGVPQDVTFSNDGTKMYAVGNDDSSVNQYTLSTAFDLSTASYDNITFNTTSQDSGAEAVTFSSDGTKMYVVGAVGDSIFQYSTGSLTSTNRMDAAQLNAVSDANHYTLGDDLDLAVTLTMPDSGSTSPTSDGVSINYDAQVKNAGAILGTDYEWDRPNADTVNFKALSNENFKIRVV